MIKEDNFSYHSQLTRRITGDNAKPKKPATRNPYQAKQYATTYSGAKIKPKSANIAVEVGVLDSLLHSIAAVLGFVALWHSYLA